jgi:hypothetical protein
VAVFGAVLYYYDLPGASGFADSLNGSGQNSNTQGSSSHVEWTLWNGFPGFRHRLVCYKSFSFRPPQATPRHFPVGILAAKATTAGEMLQRLPQTFPNRYSGQHDVEGPTLPHIIKKASLLRRLLARPCFRLVPIKIPFSGRPSLYYQCQRNIIGATLTSSEV